jgi:hypothetical protein
VCRLSLRSLAHFAIGLLQMGVWQVVRALAASSLWTFSPRRISKQEKGYVLFTRSMRQTRGLSILLSHVGKAERFLAVVLDLQLILLVELDLAEGCERAGPLAILVNVEHHDAELIIA